MRSKNRICKGLFIVLVSRLQLLLQLSSQPADGWRSPRGLRHRRSTATRLFAFKAQEKGKLYAPEIKGERPAPKVEELFLARAPGQIVNTEEELQTGEEIMESIENGTRTLPDWFYESYSLEDVENKLYDPKDNTPGALRDGDLGRWTVRDIDIQMDYEWEKDKPGPEGDPNKVAFKDWETYLPETLKDEDGVEIGWSPIGGHSHPVDERTIIGWSESYNIRNITKDPNVYNYTDFHDGDLEIRLNEEIKEYRKSLPIIETYEDPFFKEYQVPCRVAKWHGYDEQWSYPVKNFTNNRFTKPENMTDFGAMTPHEARTTAVRYARAKNAEWLPNGVSQEYHRRQREPLERYGSILGTLREGEKDPELVEAIEPAMKVVGSVLTLLSIHNGNIFRFKYWGQIKNKYGTKCWTRKLIRDCGVECANVILETGFRQRDPDLDGGDHWYGDYGNGYNGDDWNDGTYEPESWEEEYDRIEASFPDDDPQFIEYYKIGEDFPSRTEGRDDTDAPRGWVEYDDTRSDMM